MAHTSQQKKAIAGVFTACFFFGSNAIIARMLTDPELYRHHFPEDQPISIIAICFWRWTLATLTLGILLCRQKLRRETFLFFKNDRTTLIAMLTAAVIGVSLVNILIYQAAITTSAINLGLMSATGPIFMMILARIFLKHPISQHNVWGGLLAIFGVLYLITEGNIQHLQQVRFTTGDLLMITAVLGTVIYTLLLDKKPKNISINGLLWVFFLTGTLALLPFYLYCHTLFPSYSLKLWGVLLYLGLGPSLISFYSWNYAATVLSPTLIGIIYLSTPIFAALMAIFILHESFASFHLISFLLILPGISYSILKSRTKP